MHDGLRVTIAGPVGRASRCGTPPRCAPPSWRSTWRCRPTSCRSTRCRTFVASHSGWTGVPQCREALALADENSWSPRETEPPATGLGRSTPASRRRVQRAGLRPLGPTHRHPRPARRGGRRRRRVRRVAAPAGRAAGARRTPRGGVPAVGLEYFTVVAADARDPDAVVRRMLATRARARSRSPPRRAPGRLEQPPWWIPTETVDAAARSHRRAARRGCCALPRRLSAQRRDSP